MEERKKLSRMSEKLEAASQCIKEGEEPKVLSNEFLKEYFNCLGGTISSNDMVTLRRSLPFIKDWIIPVREEKKGLRRDKRPMGFIKFHDEESYNNYELTERNFRFLSEEEIDYIRKKLAEREITDNRTLMKFLTIGDAILTQNRRGVYSTLNKRPLIAYIRESSKTVEIILRTMREMHVISQKGELYRWNNEDQRKEDKEFDEEFNQEIIDNQEEYDTMSVTDDHSSGQSNNDRTDEGIALLKRMFTLMQEQKKALQSVDRLKRELCSIQAENTELKNQLSALNSVERDYKRLAFENKKLQKNVDQYAENVKDYRGFKKVVKERVENTMDRFALKLSEAVQEYEDTHNKARFIRNVNAISADTTSSVVSMVIAMNK